MRLLGVGTVVGVGCWFFATCAAAQVRIEGYTYTMDDKGDYHAVAGVEIRAYRADGPLLDRPKESDSRGHFEFPVRQGDPFWIVFSQGDKVPELHMLAGKDGVSNSVHVALLTKAQAKQRGIGLEWKRELLLQIMPKNDPFAWKIKAMLKEP